MRSIFFSLSFPFSYLVCCVQDFYGEEVFFVVVRKYFCCVPVADGFFRGVTVDIGELLA